MKILHLVHNFPPEFRGGTEVYLEGLCQHQMAAGHEVTVLTGSEKHADRNQLLKERRDGIQVFRFSRSADSEPYGIVFYLSAFEKLLLDFLAENTFDLVHLHHWLNLGNEGVRIVTGAGIPAVITLHDLYALCPRFFMIRPDGTGCGPETLSGSLCLDCAAEDLGDSREWLARAFQVRREGFRIELEAANRVIVPSHSHGVPFVEAGMIKESALTVLPHGLVRPVSGSVWEENIAGPLRVGTWGNQAPGKGVDLLLDAVALMEEKQRARMEVHLFGTPVNPEYGALLKQKAAGLAHCFHGDFSDWPLAKLGRGLDLAVFPSRAKESYSMVLDEAIALGLPVVVSDAGALPERVGEEGVVFPAGDVAALSRTLADLEKNRSRLKHLASRLARKKWTLDDNWQCLEGLYGEVLREEVRRPSLRACRAREILLKDRHDKSE